MDQISANNSNWRSWKAWRFAGTLICYSALAMEGAESNRSNEAAKSIRGTEGTQPLSAPDSLRAIHTKPGLRVELVVSEPLIESPVAIDWGADGRLWVCEMRDYPTGMDEQWKPGGRIKFLRDTNGDGHYDTATIFLEDLPFPTGVTAWRNGVLVSAAPDILYAEDTDGDGRADKVEKLFSGFYTENYQARVNSLSLGLDNWIYGANGLLGGTIHGEARGVLIDIRNRDFRMNPATGAFEPASGLTQQSRVRDDWGNWFGCDNGRALLNFPLPDRYVRRNPHVPAADPIVVVPRHADANRIFPISRVLERFNDPHAANRVTSGCGLGLYRDTLLGEEFYGNAFTCEPVHNLVHREVLSEDNLSFTSRRAEDERASEFLASTDNWFRPAQVRTGPDGALYVVDMYRFLIEHPRWISADRLAKIDVRAGANHGRIYRVVPEGKPLRPVQDLAKLNTISLADALDTPNGTERDRVHAELLARNDAAAVSPLSRIARKSSLPQARLHALCVLDGLNALTPKLVQSSLSDSEPHVRREAIRLAEKFLSRPASPDEAALIGALLKLADDPSLIVRAQLAFSLGEWRNARAGETLGRLAVQDFDQPGFRAAVLSSAANHVSAILDAVMRTPEAKTGRTEWIAPLLSTATATGDSTTLAATFAAILPVDGQPLRSVHFTALTALLEAVDRRQETFASLIARHADVREMKTRLDEAFVAARKLAADDSTAEAGREPAIRLLGRNPETLAEETRLLCKLATSSTHEILRKAAFATLRRLRQGEVAEILLLDWPHHSPARRGEILELLLTREDWILAMLQSVKRGTMQPSEIALADRERLTQSSTAAVRELALDVFPRSNAGGRTEVLARFESALRLSGETRRGADVFAKICASCHAFAGQGHAVGPNLATLRGKEPDYWLKNILDPSAVIEPRFVNYQIETKDGRSLSGVIQSETSTSLTLILGGGATETLLRSDLKKIRASALSMMPEGLEQGLEPHAFADLIAYLKSSPSAAAKGK